MSKLSKKELETIQELNTEFNKIKVKLGDLALQKHGLCLRVEKIKSEFSENEKALAEKYGADAVINLETGEVTKKEVEEVTQD